MYKIEIPKLRLAEENPWYVLATIYGEEPDEDTQNKNRMAWNSWTVSKLNESDKQAIALSRKDGLGEIVNWEGENGLKKEVEKLFKQRLPNKELPNCGAIIDFSKTKFSKEVNFGSFFFCSYVLFSDSEFLKDVNLSSAWFGKIVVSIKTTFSGKANFDSAIFEDHVTFSNAFFNSLSYQLTVFEGQFNFSRAAILAESDFTFCVFNMSCDFSEVHFFKEYPTLRNTIFRERITLSVKENTDKVISWPDHEDCEQDPEIATASCEVLRHLMNTQGLSEQAHFFFRREMQFASKIGSIWQRLPYLLFGWFSDYGNSIKLPTIWLLGLWLLPAMVYWSYFYSGGYTDIFSLEFWNSVVRSSVLSSGLSLGNLFQFTGLQRVYLIDIIKELPWELKLLGGLQTLLAIPLLFLLLLGLRNRFRLK